MSKPTLPESTPPKQRSGIPDWLADFESAVTLSMERAGQHDPIRADSLAATRQRTEQAIAVAAKKTPQALAEAVKRNDPVTPYMAQEAKRAEQRNKDLFSPPVAPISPSAERVLYNEEAASPEDEYVKEREEELERANMELYSKYIRRITADELAYDERLHSEYYNTRRVQEQAGQNYNDNFELFQEANIGLNEHILDQKAGDIGNMRFGVANVAETGCEAIAVYNVLCDLDADISPAGVIYVAETSGLMELGGKFGIMPRNTPKLLDYFGVKYRRVNSSAVMRNEKKGYIDDGKIYIVSIWNDILVPTSGIHTFEMRYDSTNPQMPWTTYNRYTGMRRPYSARSFADILVSQDSDTGRIITGAFLSVISIEE